MKINKLLVRGALIFSLGINTFKPANANPAVLAPIGICAGTAGVGCVLIGTAIVGGIVVYVWKLSNGKRVVTNHEGHIIKSENNISDKNTVRGFLYLIDSNVRKCEPCDNEDIEIGVYLAVCEKNIVNINSSLTPYLNWTIGQLINELYKTNFETYIGNKISIPLQLWKKLNTKCFCNNNGNVVVHRFSPNTLSNLASRKIPNLTNLTLSEVDCILYSFGFNPRFFKNDAYHYEHRDGSKIYIHTTNTEFGRKGEVKRIGYLKKKTGNEIRYNKFGEIMKETDSHLTGEIIKL